MGVVGEACAFANVKVVEHEEGGEVAEGHCSNGSPNDSTNALLGFDGENTLYDGSGDGGHVLRW